MPSRSESPRHRRTGAPDRAPTAAAPAGSAPRCATTARRRSPPTRTNSPRRPFHAAAAGNGHAGMTFCAYARPTALRSPPPRRVHVARNTLLPRCEREVAARRAPARPRCQRARRCRRPAHHARDAACASWQRLSAQRARRDPLAHDRDRRRVEERPAERHARADRGVAFELLHEVARVRDCPARRAAAPALRRSARRPASRSCSPRRAAAPAARRRPRGSRCTPA